MIYHHQMKKNFTVTALSYNVGTFVYSSTSDGAARSVMSYFLFILYFLYTSHVYIVNIYRDDYYNTKMMMMMAMMNIIEIL